MAREGMAELINTLRNWCDEQTMSDTILLSYLDQTRRVKREPLSVLPEYNAGVSVWYEYQWQSQYVEGAASGTTAWKVENTAGSAIGTAAYSINYDARSLRFSADQGGTAYVLNCRTYDLHRAAALVWKAKAAAVASRFDVSTDNHDLKRSQLLKHYQQMARQYESMAPARTVERVRDDANI